MAKKQQSKDGTTEVFENVEQSLTKAEMFFEKYSTQLMYGVGALLAVVLAYYGFVRFYQEPKELEAQQEIFMAQSFFEQDSLNLALNGNGANLGFLDIAEEYSSTKAGNLANYYAGICYLNMGKFEDAIAYLDKFSASDKVLSVVAKGAIGDAFLELNQPEEAMDYYLKAANMRDNNFVTPIYLDKAAQTAEILENYAKALELYERIKADYPESNEAKDADKNISFAKTKVANK